MPKQKSLCCYADIKLTGKDRPDAFECEKCGRIIGAELPERSVGEVKIEDVLVLSSGPWEMSYDLEASQAKLDAIIGAERQRKADMVEAERAKMINYLRTVLNNLEDPGSFFTSD